MKRSVASKMLGLVAVASLFVFTAMLAFTLVVVKVTADAIAVTVKVTRSANLLH